MQNAPIVANVAKPPDLLQRLTVALGQQ